MDMVFLNADRLSCGSPRKTNSVLGFYRKEILPSKYKSGGWSEVHSPLSQEV